MPKQKGNNQKGNRETLLRVQNVIMSTAVPDCGCKCSLSSNTARDDCVCPSSVMGPTCERKFPGYYIIEGPCVHDNRRIKGSPVLFIPRTRDGRPHLPLFPAMRYSWGKKR
jgi:hypothetical protein